MADEADFAFVLEEQSRASGIAFQQKNTVQLHPIGTCYYCHEAVGPKQKFCDSDCSADWERERRLKALSAT